MPIIYTYPVKSTANDNDLILISDSQDSNKTKQIKIGDLPGGSGTGVSSVTATLPVVSSGGNTPVISLKDLTGFGTAGQVIKVNSNADGLEWGAAGGSTLPDGPDHAVQYKNGSAFAGGNDLTFHPTNNIFSVKHTVIIKGQGNGNPAGRLKLNCEQDSHAITLEGPAHSGGADYNLKFPSAAPGNTQILQSNNAGQLSWINTPSGGSGGVSQVTAGGVIPVSNGTPLIVNPTSGNVVVTSASYGGVSNVGHVPAGGSNITFLRGDGTWVTPTNTVYGIMGSGNSYAAGLVLAGSVTHSDQYLRKDGTWATPVNTNTNIANTNLQLDNNRNLDLSNGEAADYALTFISTLGGSSKNLFKFDQIGATSPRFTVGHTESAYEGTILLEGNGSNRTGQIQLENAAGTYYTSIKAPTTFGANQNINYILPNLQGVANSVLTNNGSGTLSWSGITEEATWTPTSANANTISNVSGKYTKIGNTVFASFAFTMSGSTSISLSGLPFSGVYTGANKGTSIISVNNCASVQGQIVGGQMVAATSFTFNAYTGSGAGLPTKLQTTTSSMYQTAGGTYSGIIIYQTS